MFFVFRAGKNILYMKHYFLAIVLLSFCSCHKKTQQAMPPMEIEVLKVEALNLPKSMDFIGQVYSNYDISVQPRISGFLVSSHYSNGMLVKKGQLIYQIDPRQLTTELTQAQAQKFSTEAKLVEARNNYKRAVPLAEINALSQLNLDQYRAEFLSAEAADKAAMAALHNAKLNLGYTKIYSPIDGIIAESVTAIGDYVGSGSQFPVLTKISSVDTITCQLPMPVTDYLAYRTRAGISSPTFDNDSLLSNIVLTLSDGSQYDKQGFYMYTKKDVGQDMGVIIFVVGFENFDSQLKIGQYAKVTADIGKDQKVIVVPQKAVNQTQGINNVMILKADSTAEYKRVTLGETRGNMWVINSGIEQGDNVLLEGSLKVKDGMKIVPKFISMQNFTQDTIN